MAGRAKDKPTGQETPSGKVANPVGRPKGAKNKPRPTRYDNEAQRIEAESVERLNIVTRQRDDCRQLSTIIVKAMGQPSLDSGDVGRLVRAAEILHGLEREAHDFGNKGQAANAVMLIPVAAETMAQWQILSDQIIPKADTPPPGMKVINTNVSIEEDVIGHPDPTEDAPATDPAKDRGPQGAGGKGS